MALNGLLDIELTVPDPEQLAAFWERRGMLRTSDDVLGTADRPVQLRLADGPYRHLSQLHLSCDTEQDLADINGRLEGLGVSSSIDGTTLTCVDPVHDHRVVVDVGAPPPLTPSTRRLMNGPGVVERPGIRAAVVGGEPPTPRRLGHVVLGSPRIKDSTAFYFDGLGVRISDQVKHGSGTFGRVEFDHHNLLVIPAKTGYMNHYAVEVDDIDAVGLAGRAVVEQEEDGASVFGVGRHFLGSNVFWYLRDPSGTMFEFFSDMDQIVDDEKWERESARYDWGGSDGPFPVSVWGPPTPAEFNEPLDIDDIAAAREARGLD